MYYISGASFWQQNQAWNSRSSANQQDLDVITALTSKMNSALTSLSSGLASIANQRALTRVKAQLKTATTAAVRSGAISATSSAPRSGAVGSVVNKTA